MCPSWLRSVWGRTGWKRIERRLQAFVPLARWSRSQNGARAVPARSGRDCPRGVVVKPSALEFSGGCDRRPVALRRAAAATIRGTWLNRALTSRDARSTTPLHAEAAFATVVIHVGGPPSVARAPRDGREASTQATPLRPGSRSPTGRSPDRKVWSRRAGLRARA